MSNPTVHRLPATLIDRKMLNETYYSLQLQLEEPVPFLAGQYLSVKVSNQFRPYSICSLPNADGIVELCIDITPGGIGSQFAEKAPLNTQTEVLIPMGRFVLQPPRSKTIFISTGSGIAPFKPMLEEFLKKTRETTQLLWGMRYKKDIFWENVFDRFKVQHPHFEPLFCLSKETKIEDSRFFTGRVTEKLQQVESFNDWQAYLCGGGKMIEAVKSVLLEKGMRESDIFTKNIINHD